MASEADGAPALAPTPQQAPRDPQAQQAPALGGAGFRHAASEDDRWFSDALAPFSDALAPFAEALAPFSPEPDPEALVALRLAEPATKAMGAAGRAWADAAAADMKRRTTAAAAALAAAGPQPQAAPELDPPELKPEPEPEPGPEPEPETELERAVEQTALARVKRFRTALERPNVDLVRAIIIVPLHVENLCRPCYSSSSPRSL